jgi:hypothetical protein
MLEKIIGTPCAVHGARLIGWYGAKKLRITGRYMLRAYGTTGLRLARSFRCAPFPRQPPTHIFAAAGTLRVPAAAKMSYTAGTLCAIFSEFLKIYVDKNKI